MQTQQYATFGAGCFWGVQAYFHPLYGVLDTSVGYMGGHVLQPSYEQVCCDTSGHAEVIQLQFDPQKIAYADLLAHFWACHDPTQYHRQGVDVGSQYRSVIFYHDAHQAVTAQTSLLQAQQVCPVQIVTQIVAASTFWPAEAFHQHYLARHGGRCHV